jgi:hypothetical protein
MKGIRQIVHDMTDGDCFRACVASIFELPIDVPPNFCGSDWWSRWQAWMRPRNIALVRFDDSEYRPPGYSIATVSYPTWDHAIVCLDGVPVFDPYCGEPRTDYNFKEWTVFILLDPSKET